MSASISELSDKKRELIYFHGKDIRLKEFQKKINRRHSLTRVILFNTVIILLLIFIVWIFANLTI